MLKKFGPLLELADLRDELGVDKILHEIENPLIESNHKIVNIVCL